MQEMSSSQGHASALVPAPQPPEPARRTAATSSPAVSNNVDEVVKQLSDLAAGVLGMAVDTDAPLMEVQNF